MGLCVYARTNLMINYFCLVYVSNTIMCVKVCGLVISLLLREQAASRLVWRLAGKRVSTLVWWWSHTRLPSGWTTRRHRFRWALIHATRRRTLVGRALSLITARWSLILWGWALRFSLNLILADIFGKSTVIMVSSRYLRISRQYFNRVVKSLAK